MADTGQLDRASPTTRAQVQTALRHVALGVSAKTGADVFEAIARYLTLSLEADFAFVSRVLDDGRLQTLAVCYRGRIEPNLTDALPGTPVNKSSARLSSFWDRKRAGTIPAKRRWSSTAWTAMRAIPCSPATAGHSGLSR